VCRHFERLGSIQVTHLEFYSVHYHIDRSKKFFWNKTLTGIESWNVQIKISQISSELPRVVQESRGPSRIF